MRSESCRKSIGAAQGATGHVLGVGIAAVDVVNLVAEYPAEDAEVRALDQRIVRGGNTANSLAVLRQLGHRCTWAGTLADDAGAALICRDLDRCGIDREQVAIVPDAQTPTSYITLSRTIGSRTIVHYRNLREFDAGDFGAVSLTDLDWVHFEGRVPYETERMIARVRRERPELPISVEIEKPRDGVERLFHGPNLLIFSRVYAQAQSLSGQSPSPAVFLHQRAAECDPELCLLPWGAEGAYGLARGGEVVFAPAHRPAAIVDSIGAGDVFNAAAIDGLLRGLSLPELLSHANRIAGHKCGRRGFDGLIASVPEGGLLGSGESGR